MDQSNIELDQILHLLDQEIYDNELLQCVDSLLCQIHQKILQRQNKKLIPYGTAGFRDKAEYLYLICFRIGYFVGEYAKMNTQKCLGIQISASHNPIEDNGIKLANWDGGMISFDLEQIIQQFCNAEQISNELVQRITNSNRQSESMGSILIGQDTRPSCRILNRLITAGIKFTGSNVYDLGLITTPQLYFSVFSYNYNLFQQDLKDNWKQLPKFYLEYFLNRYISILDGIKITQKQTLIIDCANGIGGQVMKYLKEKLLNYEIIIINDGSKQPENLNNQCGSEYIQKMRQIPINIYDHLCDTESICVSCDGDADRIVYSLIHNKTQLNLIEGDRFTCLYALTIKSFLNQIDTLTHKLNIDNPNLNIKFDSKNWAIGIVQTAYANGASTKFILEKLNIECLCEPTGVKYVHTAAHKFDIGIYFEANGHGTILYSQKLDEDLTDLQSSLSLLENQLPSVMILRNKLRQFQSYLQLSNQATGDAYCNFLQVQVSLTLLNMSHNDWLNLYVDFPSLTSKVPVKKKEILKTNYGEDQVIEPEGIQQAINEYVSVFGPNYRCFIRASGTEDVVRIYTEGDDLMKVAQLNQQIQAFVRTHVLLNEPL